MELNRGPNGLTTQRSEVIFSVLRIAQKFMRILIRIVTLTEEEQAEAGVNLRKTYS